MHMADALISPAVGGVMAAVSAGAIAYTVSKIKKEGPDEHKIPLMGVMGAFVFAAQMINFTIPATGSSGHIGGGILLAATLGAYPAFLTITAVLLIQALFFADGGLLALGCNIFNMGILPCLLVYPLLFKPIVKQRFNRKTITLASIVAVVIGLQLGAFSVVLETLLSGVTKLPFATFAGLMQPIHLAIGLVEGIVTASVLLYVNQTRPEILLNAALDEKKSVVSTKKVVVSLLIAAVVMGGFLSVFASSNPDGLEWAIAGVTGGSELTANSEIHAAAAAVQEKTAVMPDYNPKEAQGENSAVGTGAAGIIGGTITFAVIILSGFIISFINKRKRQS